MTSHTILACCPPVVVSNESESITQADIDEYVNVFSKKKIPSSRVHDFFIDLPHISGVDITVCEEEQTLQCKVMEYLTISLLVRCMSNDQTKKPIVVCSDKDACRRTMALFVLLSKKYNVEARMYHAFRGMPDQALPHVQGDWVSTERCVLFMSETEWVDTYISNWEQEYKSRGIRFPNSKETISKDWVLSRPRSGCDTVVLCVKDISDSYLWDLSTRRDILIIGMVEDPIDDPMNEDESIPEEVLYMCDFMRNVQTNRLIKSLLLARNPSQCTLFSRDTQLVIEHLTSTVLNKINDDTNGSDTE